MTSYAGTDRLLSQLIDHHCWATTRLLRFCSPLPAASLCATVPGTLGGVARTLRHIVSSDGWYLFLLTGRRSGRPWEDTPPDDDPVAGVAFEVEQAEAHAATWRRLVARPFEPDRYLPVVRMDGEPAEFESIQVGTLVAQALNHASEHRSQICTILTAMGLQPPDLGGWTFGAETRRAMRRPMP